MRVPSASLRMAAGGAAVDIIDLHGIGESSLRDYFMQVRSHALPCPPQLSRISLHLWAVHAKHYALRFDPLDDNQLARGFVARDHSGGLLRPSTASPSESSAPL